MGLVFRWNVRNLVLLVMYLRGHPQEPTAPRQASQTGLELTEIAQLERQHALGLVRIVPGLGRSLVDPKEIATWEEI